MSKAFYFSLACNVVLLGAVAWARKEPARQAADAQQMTDDARDERSEPLAIRVPQNGKSEDSACKTELARLWSSKLELATTAIMVSRPSDIFEIGQGRPEVVEAFQPVVAKIFSETGPDGPTDFAIECKDYACQMRILTKPSTNRLWLRALQNSREFFQLSQGRFQVGDSQELEDANTLERLKQYTVFFAVTPGTP